MGAEMCISDSFWPEATLVSCGTLTSCPPSLPTRSYIATLCRSFTASWRSTTAVVSLAGSSLGRSYRVVPRSEPAPGFSSGEPTDRETWPTLSRLSSWSRLMGMSRPSSRSVAVYLSSGHRDRISDTSRLQRWTENKVRRRLSQTTFRHRRVIILSLIHI